MFVWASTRARAKIKAIEINLKSGKKLKIKNFLKFPAKPVKLSALFAILTAIICLLLPKFGQSTHYTITGVDTVAQVKTDSSLQITRKVNYFFWTPAHGFYYQQSLEPTEKVSKVRVEVDGEKVPSDIENDSGSSRITVYQPSGFFSKRQVVYHYQLTNVVVTHDDFSELNFKIIGDGWSHGLHQVTTRVLFPDQVKKLKSYVHINNDGISQGRLEQSPDSVTVIKSFLPPHTYLEMHLLFASKKMLANPLRSHDAIESYAEVQEGEISAARQKVLNRWSSLLIILVIWFILIIFSKRWRLRLPEAGQKLVIPALDPALSQVITTQDQPDGLALSGLLAQKVAAGEIEVKGDTFGKTAKYQADNWTLIRLFNEAGNGNSFNVADVKALRQAGDMYDLFSAFQYRYQRDFEAEYTDIAKLDWKKRVVLITEVLMLLPVICLGYLGGLINPVLTKAVVLSWMYAVLILFFCFFLPSMSFQDSLETAIVSLFLAYLYIFWGWSIFLEIMTILFVTCCLLTVSAVKSVNVFTSKGLASYQQVQAFRNSLEKLNRMNSPVISDWVLWKEILPYAVAFGLEKKACRQLKRVFGEEMVEADLAQIVACAHLSKYFQSWQIPEADPDSDRTHDYHDHDYHDGGPSGSSSGNSGSSGFGGSGGGAF